MLDEYMHHFASNFKAVLYSCAYDIILLARMIRKSSQIRM